VQTVAHRRVLQRDEKIGFANKPGRRYIPDGDNQKQMLLRICKPAGETLQEKLFAFRSFLRRGSGRWPND
jgi:hypothetical protein